MDFKYSVSGYQVKGSWVDIVEHGELLINCLKKYDLDYYSEELNQFDEWRPKRSESYDDLITKTSDKNSLNANNKLISKLTIIEEFVYENVMTKISPCYFDNNLISANLSKISDDEYRLEININDDDLNNRLDIKQHYK